MYSEDSDPDTLGPLPTNERNRKFDAMQAKEEEEVDGEAYVAPQEYSANPDLWR